MTKTKLIQLLQDWSKPENENNYEKRHIIDSDFKDVAEVIESCVNKEVDELKERLADTHELAKKIQAHIGQPFNENLSDIKNESTKAPMAG